MEIINIIDVIHGRWYTPNLDLNEKMSMNGHGFCNQLFQLINRICQGSYGSEYIDIGFETYIGPFSIDIHDGDLILSSEILNLDEMNRLHGYKFIDMQYFPVNTHAFKRYYSFHDVLNEYKKNPDIFSKISNQIIFADKFNNIVKQIIDEKGISDTKVNLVHLKIEKVAREWCEKNDCLDIFEESINKYREHIYNLDRNVPICVLLEDNTDPFIQEISKDYNIILIDKEKDLYPKLESKYVNKSDIKAFCDILFARNLNIDTFIGKFEDNGKKYSLSTFSLFLYLTLKYNNAFSA